MRRTTSARRRDRLECTDSKRGEDLQSGERGCPERDAEMSAVRRTHAIWGRKTPQERVVVVWQKLELGRGTWQNGKTG